MGAWTDAFAPGGGRVLASYPGYPACVTGDDAQILYERRQASAQSIAPLRHLVVSFAAHVGATPRQLEDVALAVSEALTNAVQHAYPDASCRGEMAVRAAQHGRMLDILISDDGIGMHPQSDGNRSGVRVQVPGRFWRSFGGLEA